MNAFARLLIPATLLLSALAPVAEASVVINGTRAVYPAKQREISVRLDNKRTIPVLVRTWLDNGDAQASPESSEVPFSMTPPIFRMNADASQTLRIMHTGETMPADRESVYWLNVLEVPPKADGSSNTLQFAFRNRIKLFYRPTNLAGQPIDAPAQVRWSLIAMPDGSGMALKGDNPTPYHVNLGTLELKAGTQSWGTRETGGMVKPMSSELFPLEDLGQRPGVPMQVEFKFITDHGAQIDGTLPLAP